jgi:hypothetical protein
MKDMFGITFDSLSVSCREPQVVQYSDVTVPLQMLHIVADFLEQLRYCSCLKPGAQQNISGLWYLKTQSA